MSKISSYQYQVSNDSFSINLKWQANVSKTLGHNTYNITATVKSVKVNYIKTYLPETNNF